MHTREGLLSVWKDPLHCFGLPAITALVRESVCVCEHRVQHQLFGRTTVLVYV